MEEDQDSARDELTTHDQESTIVDDYDSDDQAETQDVEDKQEKNWRELRKKTEEAEKQARHYEEKAKLQEDLIKSLVSQSPQQYAPPPKEVDEFDEIADDEYLSKGQSRKLLQKDARAIAREEFLALDKERERLRFKDRLVAKFSDFDEIVNNQTIAKFEKQEPELAATIADLGDPYKMGLQTYHLIKSSGLVKSKDTDRHTREVQNKLEKAEKSVASPQAYNKRPMAKAFSSQHMSKTERDQMYEEMMGFASMSGGY